MTRRALTRNIKLKRPDEKTAEKYMLFWRKGDLYRHPERFPGVNAPTLFGDERPMHLEVGSGTGEFLIALAEDNPEEYFVGVDVWTKVVYYAVEQAAERKLDNIKFIRAPFEFTYPLLVPESLRTVFVHYPDPHIRSRGMHKILNPTFFEEIHRALEPGGLASIVTDHEEFFQEILDLVEQDEKFERQHQERYLIGYDPPVKSRYQLLWEKHDVPPLRLELLKPERATND